MTRASKYAKERANLYEFNSSQLCDLDIKHEAHEAFLAGHSVGVLVAYELALEMFKDRFPTDYNEFSKERIFIEELEEKIKTAKVLIGE